MLTKKLLTMMERTERPRVARTINWALEKITGYSVKGETGLNLTGDISEWYARNGYYRIGFPNFSSHAGISITQDKALEATAVYAGVKLIAEDMGALPFHVYERTKDRKIINRAYDHPLYSVLHDLVNPEVSAGEFVEALTAHALLTGNGYAGIERYGDGRHRIALQPWQPQDVRSDKNRAGVTFYWHREGTEKAYPASDVFNLRGFTLDCIKGDNVLSRARHAIGLCLAAEQYAGSYFASSSMVHLVLTRPPGVAALGDEGMKNLKAGWKTWHAGLKNAWEPAVLQEGTTAQLLTPKHSETQLIEQRTFQVLEVCRLLRLPPYKLADLQRAIQSNIEQQSIEYIQMTLSPWVDRWRRTVHRCLLTFDEQISQRLYAQHDVNALQRGDFQMQAEGFRKLLEKGVYSINEVRHWFDLNPITGGDEHFIQLNMSTVEDIAAGVNLPSALQSVRGKE